MFTYEYRYDYLTAIKSIKKFLIFSTLRIMIVKDEMIKNDFTNCNSSWNYQKKYDNMICSRPNLYFLARNMPVRKRTVQRINTLVPLSRCKRWYLEFITSLNIIERGYGKKTQVLPHLGDCSKMATVIPYVIMSFLAVNLGWNLHCTFQLIWHPLKCQKKVVSVSQLWAQRSHTQNIGI